MMQSDTLINIKLKSFARFDDAMAMSDLLNSETGADYSIMSDNHLGFTVKRNQENTVNEEPKPVVSNNGDRHEKKTYRQSFRGFLEHFSELILGMFLAVSPYTGLGWIFSLFNIQVIPEWFNLSEAGKVVSIGGYVLILYGLRFIYSYYARKLFIEDEFVLSKKGIIAQDHIQIRYVDIKTVGIRQTIIERLLGIGTLHLASAGTNGEVDIIFDNLINPSYMRSRVQQLIEKTQGNGRR
jgi:uncharacterized membrane protein YdbT with pleckstrin-like domain